MGLSESMLSFVVHSLHDHLVQSFDPQIVSHQQDQVGSGHWQSYYLAYQEIALQLLCGLQS